MAPAVRTWDTGSGQLEGDIAGHRWKFGGGIAGHRWTVAGVLDTIALDTYCRKVYVQENSLVAFSSPDKKDGDER